ncbi:class I SAM-dependent methyltransferase [Paenibacillus tritici]|uniref:Class I SAM-dependent methyltransferase n=1 Tax=Paenibacillus tritici TaxID=1873425 RepID=A0ABX2DN71_9BACL|nr:class I SAM-dependent methyltransferase [Paenibacillus tritici]NQX46074.1 class I SAM-dependent methyltransferase [Paenibacillus tritici]QUL52717.1 class I SAM-dependent methyltransferase [Paenibacillus tritici]
MDQERLIRIFDRQATDYDRKREDPQQQRWRRNLISDAKGDVLELAVGAGANFPFYPRGVRITAADFSGAMVEKARQAARHYHLDANCICADMEDMSFPAQSFDTVVSTLSMCSYKNPLGMLEKINRWCKPDGTILLMEHGIGSNFMVSTLQRALNPLLYRIYGCHHTRDILGLVRESGMLIQRAERYSLNMVHLIWAAPQQ